MIFTIINKAAGTRSYLGGGLTVAEGGSTTIPSALDVILGADAQLIYDLIAGNVILNDSVNDYAGNSAIDLLKIFAVFNTDKLAMNYLYYNLPINIVQSAATAAGATVWAMRNNHATLTAHIERLALLATFTGTSGAKVLRYDICRFSGATPSAGTALSVIKSNNLAGSSGVDARFLDTGLTMTGATLEAPLDTIACPEVNGAVAKFEHTYPIVLAPGEGLAIVLSSVAASVGQALQGGATWCMRLG